MGKETVLFKSEEPRDLPGVVDFLRQLADKLAQNELVLRQGESELALSLPNRVVLELKVEEEAKAAGTKRTFEIEIEWTDGDESAGGVTLG